MLSWRGGPAVVPFCSRLSARTRFEGKELGTTLHCTTTTVTGARRLLLHLLLRRQRSPVVSRALLSHCFCQNLSHAGGDRIGHGSCVAMTRLRKKQPNCRSCLSSHSTNSTDFSSSPRLSAPRCDRNTELRACGVINFNCFCKCSGIGFCKRQVGTYTLYSLYA